MGNTHTNTHNIKNLKFRSVHFCELGCCVKQHDGCGEEGPAPLPPHALRMPQYGAKEGAQGLHRVMQGAVSS